MREVLLDYLACPHCHSQTLAMNAVQRLANGDIFSGGIRCNACGNNYPIIEGIPYLVTNGLRSELLDESFADAEGDEKLAEKVTVANVRFHNLVADVYEKDLSTKGVFGRFTQNRIREALKFLKARTNGKLLLDMGCGTGNVLQNANDFFESVIGTDVSVSMLKKAQRGGLDVVIGSCTRSPYKRECADVVSAFSVLHHLLEPREFFEEAYRLLKTGGWIYTDWDPNAEGVEKVHNSAYALKIQELYGEGLNWLFGKMKNRTTFHFSSEEIGSLSRLAEYHHHYSNGFYRHQLETILQEIGYREIQIIPHWNSLSFEKGSLSVIPFDQRLVMWAKMLVTFCSDSALLAPNLMIFAQK